MTVGAGSVCLFQSVISPAAASGPGAAARDAVRDELVGAPRDAAAAQPRAPEVRHASAVAAQLPAPGVRHALAAAAQPPAPEVRHAPPVLVVLHAVAASVRHALQVPQYASRASAPEFRVSPPPHAERRPGALSRSPAEASTEPLAFPARGPPPVSEALARRRAVPLWPVPARHAPDRQAPKRPAPGRQPYAPEPRPGR